MTRRYETQSNPQSNWPLTFQHSWHPFWHQIIAVDLPCWLTLLFILSKNTKCLQNYYYLSPRVASMQLTQLARPMQSATHCEGFVAGERLIRSCCVRSQCFQKQTVTVYFRARNQREDLWVNTRQSRVTEWKRSFGGRLYLLYKLGDSLIVLSIGLEKGIRSSHESWVRDKVQKPIQQVWLASNKPLCTSTMFRITEYLVACSCHQARKSLEEFFKNKEQVVLWILHPPPPPPTAPASLQRLLPHGSVALIIFRLALGRVTQH